MKLAWQTFGTSGFVMKMWFQTEATAPLSSEEMWIVAVVVRAVVAPSGLRANPVEMSNQVEGFTTVPSV